MNALVLLLALASAPTPHLLRGAGGSFEARVQVDASATLRLPLRASELLDLDASLVHLELDGEPRKSARLRELVDQGELSISGLPPGPHDLRLRARLRTGPCKVGDLEESWLEVRVPSASTAARAAAAKTPTTLGAHLERWRAGAAVHLDGPHSSAPQRVGLVSAAQAVERAGARATTGEAQLALRLSVADARDPAYEALRAADGVASGALAARGRTLWVLALDDERLRATAHALSAGLPPWCRARDLCLVRPDDAPAEQDDHRAPIVWSLRDRGAFVARGAGQHRLTFVVPRPDTYRIDEAPLLELRALATRVDLVDERSGLTVFVNERPVSAWRLDALAGAEQTLRLRLPKDLWSAPRWSVEVRVDLKPDDDEHCEDEGAALVVLSPDSRLLVRRREARHRGISGFFEAARAARPVMRIEGAPPVEALLRFARQTASLASLTPRAPWRDAGAGPAVVLQARPEELRLLASEERAWVAGELALLPAGTPLALWRDGDTEELVFTSMSDDAPPIPLWALHAHAAAFADDAWVPLGAPAQIRGFVDVDLAGDERLGGASAASVDDGRRGLINFVWAGLIAASLIALVLFWRPGRRRDRAAVGLGIEHPQKEPA